MAGRGLGALDESVRSLPTMFPSEPLPIALALDWMARAVIGSLDFSGLGDDDGDATISCW
jgi:hypothetical protein